MATIPFYVVWNMVRTWFGTWLIRKPVVCKPVEDSSSSAVSLVGKDVTTERLKGLPSLGVRPHRGIPGGAGKSAAAHVEENCEIPFLSRPPLAVAYRVEAAGRHAAGLAVKARRRLSRHRKQRLLDSGIPDSLRNLPDRERGILQRGVEPELATSSREGPASHGVTLPGVIFRMAARAKKSYALDVGCVVGEVREVDFRVLPLALLADRTGRLVNRRLARTRTRRSGQQRPVRQAGTLRRRGIP